MFSKTCSSQVTPPLLRWVVVRQEAELRCYLALKISCDHRDERFSCRGWWAGQ